MVFKKLILIQSTYPSQNYDTEVNGTANHMVGRYSNSSSNYFNGYMSHVAFVDGTVFSTNIIW